MSQSESSARPRMLHVLAGFAAVYVIWGSTYLGIRFAIESLPPFLMAGTRFLLAGALLYAWSRFHGADKPLPGHWISATIIGGLLLFVANGGVVWSERRVSSGMAALLVATMPVWMVLLDWLRPDGPRPGARVIAGLILGLVGIAILTGPKDFAGGLRVDPVGAAVLVGASLAWSIGSLYSRSAAKPSSALLAAAMQMIAGGALHLMLGTGLGEWHALDPARVTIKSVAALLYLLFFGSIIGFTAYMWLLRVTTPARVSTYAYVNPVVAVLLGWGLGGESVGLRTLIAAAVIVTAVVFITSAPAPPSPSRPAQTGFPVIVADSVGGSARPPACACSET